MDRNWVYLWRWTCQPAPSVLFLLIFIFLRFALQRLSRISYFLQWNMCQVLPQQYFSHSWRYLSKLWGGNVLERNFMLKIMPSGSISKFNNTVVSVSPYNELEWSCLYYLYTRKSVQRVKFNMLVLVSNEMERICLRQGNIMYRRKVVECLFLLLLVPKLLDRKSRKMCWNTQMYKWANFKGR